MRGWPVELALLASGRWPVSAERLGLRAPSGPVGAIWVHGASLGEARVARRLADALPGGFATADTAAGALVAGALRPLDHPLALAAAWSDLRPRLVVMIEGSYWPALAARARASGVRVVAVAARPSRWGGLRERRVGRPDVVFARDATAEDWFRALGIPVAGVCGPLKGGPPPPNPLTWPGPFLVGASTRSGDEAALLDARDRVAPDHAVLLAPRHVERAREIEALATRPLVRRSQLGGPVPAGVDVLLDTRGELAGALVGAAAALIGGTFDPRVGGHSAGEARAAGVPVVAGPETWANPDGSPVHRATSPAALAAALAAALRSPRPAPPPDPLPDLARALVAMAGPPALETCPRPWARALVPLQRAGIAARRARARVRADAPVVAVGSASARGSGKTATALWLADVLAGRGHRVGVTTRGYGRARFGLGESDRHGADADWLGDAGALFALAGHRVAAHADRSRAIDALSGSTVVVLEDGLQCSGVEVDVRIATIDARFPSARGPFPAGDAREPSPSADVRVAFHVGPLFPAPDDARVARCRPGLWSRPVDGPACAFAGIGRPADFFAGLPVGTLTRSFPDHHRYSAADLKDLHAWAGTRALLTTDRDAVRLPPEERDRVHHRGLRLEIEAFPLDLLPPGPTP